SGAEDCAIRSSVPGPLHSGHGTKGKDSRGTYAYSGASRCGRENQSIEGRRAVGNTADASAVRGELSNAAPQGLARRTRTAPAHGREWLRRAHACRAECG